MKIKIIQPKNTVACEGELPAHVKAVKAKGENKIMIEWGVVCNGGEFVVAKDYPAKLEPKTELYKDAQTILARPFAEAELSGEFDTETLTGLACRVVVVHRRTSGGKTAAVVTAVLPKD